jgi:hypothetical protein
MRVRESGYALRQEAAGMARRKNALPELKFHAPTKQYCVYLGRDRKPLGRDEAAAKAKYRRLLRDLVGAQSQPPGSVHAVSPGSLTVAELMLAYRAEAAKKHDAVYMTRLDVAIRAATEAKLDSWGLPLGQTPARDFRGRALKAVRIHLLNRPRHPIAPGDRRQPKPLSRSYVNTLISNVRSAFVWAAGEDLIPAENLVNLRAVLDLRAGEGGRETEHVMPIDAATVDATLPFCSRQVAAMIRVQRNSGARPGEVCDMRRCDLSLTPGERLQVPGTKPHFRVSALEIEGDDGKRVPIWLYVPARHKTTHKGKVRVIVLAPPAQEALRPFLDRLGEAHLFSPKEEQAERFVAMRKARRSRVQPSQKCRKKRGPLRTPRDHFTTDTYRRSIKRAIARANRARRKADPGAELLPEWHPHQLRHGAAVQTSERFDNTFAAALLGHSGVDMIATYVKQTIQKAARAAAELD